MRLFISYAKVDKWQVKELVEVFSSAGHDPWYDYKLMPGQNWKGTLEKAITDSEVFVYVLTQESVDSEWCQWEFSKAIHLEKPIIPILLRSNAKIPEIIRRYQYLDLTDGLTPEKVARLVGALSQIIINIPLSQIPPSPTDPKGEPAQAVDASITSFDKFSLERATVQIKDKIGKTIGTGFLIRQHLILTYVSIINQSLGNSSRATKTPSPNIAIYVGFPAISTKFQMLTSTIDKWRTKEHKDMHRLAVLKLNQDLPNVEHIKVVPAGKCDGHSFKAFGFSQGGEIKGQWVTGKIRSSPSPDYLETYDTAETEIPLDEAFSGGLVWDEQYEGVIGIVSIYRTQSNDCGIYIVPLQILSQCPKVGQQDRIGRHEQTNRFHTDSRTACRVGASHQ